MKPVLQLQITPQLSLTPQLQQAIRFLQLSTLDLKTEIQQAVEANPMLEIEATEEELPAPTQASLDESTDFQWSEIYHITPKSNATDRDINYDNLYCTTTNLHDHLYWQLNLTPMSDVDKVIALAIIDAINDQGFLTQTIDELQESLNSTTYPIDSDEINVVRHHILTLDPIGCGALNLAESLCVQLSHLPASADHTLIDLTKTIIAENFSLLAPIHHQKLIKRYQLTQEKLHQIMDLLRHLNPKPGELIQPIKVDYVIPDLMVKKIQERWRVTLNNQTLPILNINRHYASLIKKAHHRADNQFLKQHLQEAKWLLKSIQSRQDTLLKVATFIVEFQHDFFTYGPEAMKPLKLSDVAQRVGLHESTVSRVTTQKYIHTPRGLIELKYFFSSHLSTTHGGECSSTAIQAMLKKMIQEENISSILFSRLLSFNNHTNGLCPSSCGFSRGT